jgi:hypothetical protein
VWRIGIFARSIPNAIGISSKGSASFLIDTMRTTVAIPIIIKFPKLTAPKAVVAKKLKKVSIIKESSLQRRPAYSRFEPAVYGR